MKTIKILTMIVLSFFLTGLIFVTAKPTDNDKVYLLNQVKHKLVAPEFLEMDQNRVSENVILFRIEGGVIKVDKIESEDLLIKNYIHSKLNELPIENAETWNCNHYKLNVKFNSSK